ncbi:MAG: single-stranded DNA-binding protein [Patescibacteria group bacterium]
MNLNKVFILGRLTADPQLRTTPGGQSVTTFSLATSRFWKDKTGNRQEKTEYHNIVAWGRQAEIAGQYLTRGALAFVEGRMETRSWQDKQGLERKTTEIICDMLQLGPRPAGGGEGGAFRPKTDTNPASVPQSVSQQPMVEEIPIVDLEDEMKEEVKASDIPF